MRESHVVSRGIAPAEMAHEKTLLQAAVTLRLGLLALVALSFLSPTPTEAQSLSELPERAELTAILRDTELLFQKFQRASNKVNTYKWRAPNELIEGANSSIEAANRALNDARIEIMHIEERTEQSSTIFKIYEAVQLLKDTAAMLAWTVQQEERNIDLSAELLQTSTSAVVIARQYRSVLLRHIQHLESQLAVLKSFSFYGDATTGKR